MYENFYKEYQLNVRKVPGKLKTSIFCACTGVRLTNEQGRDIFKLFLLTKV